MQGVLDNWDGLLRATGGALEKSKSYWYLLDYERRNGKWCYKSLQSIPGDISLHNDETQQKEPIERLAVHTGKKALGIFTRPDGKMKEEIQYLRGKTEDWATRIRTRHIRTEDAWYCLTASIMKTVEYPLVTSSFTKKECSYIMAPILEAGLPAIHTQRRLPRVLVHGPKRFQGYAIPDIWANQIIDHLHVVGMHCISSRSSTGLPRE